jgi:chaperone required for assembly of F1-ATPase
MAKGFDALPNRFYKTVEVAPAVGGGFAVQLDGRVPKSPAKSPLVLPTQGLAALIAGEWDAQVKVIDLNEMAATRRAFTAIDQIPPAREAVADEIARYAGSDVLCYFAAHPSGLTARQNAQWGPLLDWADAQLGLRLERAEGVVHRSQPPQTLQHARALALAADDMTLTALAEATALFGSAVLAFAVQRGRLGAPAALDLSRLDEIFQIEQWGVDDEAAVRIAGHQREAAGLQAWFEAL